MNQSQGEGARARLVALSLMIALAGMSVGCDPTQLGPQRPDVPPSPDAPKPPPSPDQLSARGNQKIATFQRAKKLIMEVHQDHGRTFYCDCDFDEDKQVDARRCGYTPRKSSARGSRVEIEHVVPASVFGQQLSAWTEGEAQCERQGKPFKGRTCAERASKAFRYMQADLYNLQPAVGEVNGDRSNLPMGEVAGEPRVYGKCDAEVGDGVFEPRPAIRGDIARAYLYMAWAYPEYTMMSPEERALMEAWSKSDPVDAWERERARRIEALQGNKNPLIK